ncbi:hypothetical protein AnigIFM60653_005834 [Aspergillus niger]|nr:hypothetical protein AnigIFM60653_005834 [Aspergillus niger]
MEPTLPADTITAPVPEIDLIVEDQYHDLVLSDTRYFIAQRLNSIMEFCTSIGFNPNQPLLFRDFIGRAISKAFFGDEQQLQWFKAGQIRNMDYITFRNVQRTEPLVGTTQAIVVDFLEPVPGQNLKAVWKPAPGITLQSVRECIGTLTDFCENSGSLESTQDAKLYHQKNTDDASTFYDQQASEVA